MAAVAAPSPRELYDTLRAHGFDLIDETDHNWLLIDRSDPKAAPLPISKHGDAVDSEMIDWVFRQSKQLKRAILHAPHRQPAKSPSSNPPPP